MKKILFASAMLGAVTMTANAQSGTNSPYSQYGLGVLSDQSQGFNRGMNGLGLGMRFSNQVNTLNPASYSAVDSLTMIFDVGLSGQITNFTESGKKLNAKNADFEYAVAAFRLLPNIGVSFGVLPFTNIGYNYTSSTKIGGTTSSAGTTSAETHSGSGGIHQGYIGIGWAPFKNFSIGANFAYLWGSYSKVISITNSDSYVNTVTKTYQATVHSYKLDFGLQYQANMTKTDLLTVGLTYSLGHSLNVNPELVTVNSNSQTSVSTTNTETVNNGLHIPHMLGLGLAWNHNNKLTIGADYSLQKWGSLDYPEVNSTTGEYVMKSGLLKDRHKITIGGEYVPDETSRKFLNRVRYRVGASYNTPYVTVNGLNGPKEYSVSAGFGIPITNSWNNRSVLNISAQWVRASAKNLITENTFRINIGITFNERWFMKWKVE